MNKYFYYPPRLPKKESPNLCVCKRLRLCESSSCRRMHLSYFSKASKSLSSASSASLLSLSSVTNLEPICC